MLYLTADDHPLARFDIIWDRAAFTVLNLSDSNGYAAFTSGLFSKDEVYLMNVRECDTQKHGGPPASVPKESLLKSFGNAFSVEEINCINTNDRRRGEQMKQHYNA